MFSHAGMHYLPGMMSDLDREVLSRSDLGFNYFPFVHRNAGSVHQPRPTLCCSRSSLISITSITE